MITEDFFNAWNAEQTEQGEVSNIHILFLLSVFYLKFVGKKKTVMNTIFFSL